MFYLLPSKATFECVAVLVRWTRTAESMLRRAAQARARATMPHSLSPKQARGRHREPGVYWPVRRSETDATDRSRLSGRFLFGSVQRLTGGGFDRTVDRAGKCIRKSALEQHGSARWFLQHFFFGRCCFGACRLPAECRVRFSLVGQYLGVFICVCMCACACVRWF